MALLTMTFLQHLAGLIDADGCYTLLDRHGADVRVNQGDKKLDLLENVEQKTGMGTIGSNGQKLREENQDHFHWNCTGENAVNIVRQILPYVVKKKRFAQVIADYECGRTQDTPVMVQALDEAGEVASETNFTSMATAATYMGFAAGKSIAKWGNSGHAIMSKTLKTKVLITCDTEAPQRIKANHIRQMQLWEEVKTERPKISGFKFPLRFSDEVQDIVPNLMTEAYAAGFAEGDGCFCIETNNGKCRLRVDITQSDSYMPLQFLRFFETGVIYHSTTNLKKADKTIITSNMYKWTVFDQEALDYMAKIRPFVVSVAVQSQIDTIQNEGITFATQDKIKIFKGCTLKRVDNPAVEKKERSKKQKV